MYTAPESYWKSVKTECTQKQWVNLLRKKGLVLLMPFPKKNSNNEKSWDRSRDKELAICLFAAVVHYLTLITHISNRLLWDLASMMSWNGVPKTQWRCVGVSLDLQNDGADITLTARLLLKFTVSAWNEIGSRKPIHAFSSLAVAYVLASLHRWRIKFSTSEFRMSACKILENLLLG